MSTNNQDWRISAGVEAKILPRLARKKGELLVDVGAICRRRSEPANVKKYEHAQRGIQLRGW